MLVTGSSEVSNALSNYTISNSLRFQSASTQYLSRTPASASNRKTWTWSGWVKRGLLNSGSSQLMLFTVNNGNTDTGTTEIYFMNDAIRIAGFTTAWRITTQVFRDPSAWYHIIVAVDTTQATATNRVKLYINGNQVTSFSTSNDPALNADLGINSNTAHYLGAEVYTGPTNYFDGYLAEVNFIDGQALTPASFGATNPYTGQWQAQKYTGTYGTNGFYLPFSNGTSTTTLGTDSSGNGNNWTLTNFTRSAGTADCWMVDVPSGNGTGPATQPSSNYAVLNSTSVGTDGTISTANLNIAYGTASTRLATLATIGMSSGKWYWEFQKTVQSSPNAICGITNVSSPNQVGVYPGLNANAWSYSDDGLKYNNGTGSAYGASWTTGDVIGVAFDADAGTLTFYKNNISQGTAFTGLTSSTYFPVVGDGSTAGTFTMAFNFGQRSFAYTPPTGFVALCTANLPASTAPIVAGNKFMDAQLWTGDGTSPRTFNVWGFKPDLMWIKGRSGATDNALIDTVRGTGAKILESNLTDAENSYGLSVSAFTSNGFTGATGSINFSYANSNAATYVGWAWQAGQGTNTTNTDGSIASVVSVNRNSGFSIVTYTGTGSAATIGHGLGIAPKMVICKARGQAENWAVYHASVGNNYALFLNTTAAQTGPSNAYWNNTTPTSTVFSVNTSTTTNAANTMVAYCFAEIAGFSKFSSYTGNGSADGPFIYCGFRPKYVLLKRTDVANDWTVHDAARNPYNAVNYDLYPNLSNAETVVGDRLDFVSNGFKLRTTGVYANASGGTYIYMAFAENPFQYANAR